MPLKLFKGIRHFKNHQFDKKKFESLSLGQAPDVIFITCSDSRIDPSLFTHTELGELFHSRNPGNIVLPASAGPSGEASAVEFALNSLAASEIIVCGHSHCGAMKGLLDPELDKKLPSTAAWLSHSQFLAAHLLKRHPELEKDPSLQLKCLTQDNILLQMEYLKTHPAVQARLDAGTLRIHGWYYEFEKGEVYVYNAQKKAFISFEQTVEETALDKLVHIVEEETLNYLTKLTQFNSQEEHALLVQLFTQVKFIGASSIWEQIATKVEERLRQEVGDLYITNDGTLNHHFSKLLKKGPAIRVANLDSIRQAIQKAPIFAAPSSIKTGPTLFVPQADDLEIKDNPHIKAKL